MVEGSTWNISSQSLRGRVRPGRMQPVTESDDVAERGRAIFQRLREQEPGRTGRHREW